MLEITFLEARVPLAKTFSLDDNGNLVKSNYPHVKRVTSHTEDINSLQGLAEALIEHAEEHRCMLKGRLNRPLDNESRAGATDRVSPTNWMCLDLDGLKGIKTPKAFMMLMGLQDYSHVLQYSSSMGVDPGKGLSCHIFVELDTPVLPSRLRAWLTHQNLSLPKLRNELSLAKDHMSLCYGLDVSTCDNGKILYISPPLLENGATDSFQGKRIQFIKGSKDVVPTAALRLDELNADTLATERDAMINTLREAQDLPARTYTTKTYRGEPILTNPDIAEISGYREERGFAYFNINGGDSWSYYHPLNAPHIISCFKGDQKFATKEFLPNYLEEHGLERAKEFKKEEAVQAKDRAREDYEAELKAANRRTEGKTWLAFLDVPTDVYYRGHYDHSSEQLNLNKTNSLIKVQHFMQDNGQGEMEWIPEWELRFDYMCDKRFSPEDRLINKYQPTKLMQRETPKKKRVSVPKTINRIIDHVVAHDKDAYDDLMNWLACIVQKVAFPRSAWVFFGVQGTGKGTLFHKILAPIIGERYCQTKLFKDMEEQFNGWLEETVICMVDEVSIGDAKHKERLMAGLKNNITEPRVSVRAMRTDQRMVTNNCSYILCSNKPDPVIVEDTDRRFHVAPYQNTKLHLTNEEIDDLLPQELQHFVDYLRLYEVDTARARTPRDNATKDHLKHISRTAIDSVSLAFQQGDIEYFMDQLPKDLHLMERSQDADSAAQAAAYRGFMEQLIVAPLEGDSQIRIHRDDLRDILSYLVGPMPKSPNKFTAYLKHHNILPKKMRINGRLAQGIEIVPNRLKHHAKDWADYNTPIAPSQTKIVPIKNSARSK